MVRLGMLLESVEPVQPVHRYKSNQHEVPNSADEISRGATSIRATCVAACDGQKVFGFDAGNVCDVRRRTAYLPGAQRVLAKVVAQAGLEEQVGAELLGVHAHRAHEHPRWDVDVTHPPAQ